MVLKIHEIFKINVRRMLRCYLLKFYFVRNFHDKIMCCIYSLVVLGTLKQDCEVKTSEILIFLPLKNNSVTIDLDSISAIISGVDTTLQIEFVKFLVQFRYLQIKIIIQKQPSGGFLKLFVKLFVDTLKKNTANLWLATSKY